MKFTITASLLLEFNKAITSIAGIITSRPSHPILGNIAITANKTDQSLTLLGTDFSAWESLKVEVEVEKEGTIILPAKLIKDITQNLPKEEDATFTQDGDAVLITSGESHFKILMPSDRDDFPDFPEFQSIGGVILTSEELKQLLKPSIAASVDELKQNLTGVNFTFNHDGIHAAATDGHRLAMSSIYRTNTEQLTITIPIGAIKQIEKLLSFSNQEEGIEFYWDENQVWVSTAKGALLSRKIEGLFPNYWSLIPQSFGLEVTFDRQKLIESLKRISIVSPDKVTLEILKDQKTIEDTWSGKITLDGESAGNKIKDSLLVEVSGEEIGAIGFNGKYLADALHFLDSSNPKMKLNTPLSPVIIESPTSSLRYLLMPVQQRTPSGTEEE